MDAQSTGSPGIVDLSATPDALGSWRHETGFAGRGRKIRRAVVASVIAVGTLGALFFTLFQPFSNPDVHLVLIDTEPADLGGGPLYAAGDATAIEQFGNQLHRYDEQHAPTRLAGVNSPRDVSTLKQRLEQIAANRSSVLVLYWTVRGLSVNGVPYIVWPGTKKNLAGERSRVEEILAQIKKHPAKTKLILLDVRPPFDASEWPAAEEFPQQLQAAVNKSGDHSLWLLTSHSSLEESHLDHATRRSYFNAFVTHGLRGRADLNDDGNINLEEFHRYVAYGVSRAVAASTGMRTTQTPLLCWGGGTNFPRTFPRLVPVLTDIEPLDNGEPAGRLFPTDVVPAEIRDAMKAELAAMPQHGAYPTPPVMPDPTQRATASPKAAANQPTPAPKKDTPAKEAKQPRTTPKTQPAGAPAAPPVSKGGPQGVARKLVAAWLWHDEAARRVSPNNATAADTAPHIVRRLQHRLLLCERAYRIHGPFRKPKADEKNAPPPNPVEQSIAAKLDELIRLFKALRAGRIELSPTATPLEKLVAEHLQRHNSIALPMHTLGMVERSHRNTGNALAANFDRLLTESDSTKLIEFLAGLTDEQRQLAELRLAGRFLNDSTANWNAVRAALQTRRYAERIVALAGGRLRWVKTILESADRHRLAGERRLLDGIGADYEAWSLRRFREAVDLYSQAANQLKLIDAAEALRNDVLHELPGLVEWARRIDDVSAEGNLRLDRLRESSAALRNLSSQLDAATSPSVSNLRRRFARLQSLHADIRADFQRTIVAPAGSILTGDEAVPGDVERFNAALRISTLTAETRLSLLRALQRAAEKSTAVSYDVPQSPLIPPERTLTAADAKRIQHRAALAVELLQLRRATLPQPDDREQAALKSAFNQLAAKPAGDWDACRRFQSALRAADESAAAKIQASVGRILADETPGDDWAAFVTRLRQLENAVRGSAFSRPIDGENAFDRIVARGRRSAALGLIAWQRRRLLAAVNDAPQSDLAALRTAAEGYRAVLPLALMTASGQVDHTGLRITSPAEVSLRESSSARFHLRLASTRNAPCPVTIWVEYDAAVLKLRPVNDAPLPVVKHTERPDSLTIALKPEQSGIGRTAVLPPGEPMTIPVEVTRLLKTRSRPATIVIHIVCGSAVVRQAMSVALPSPRAVELQASGPADVQRVTTQTATGPRLFPFPNRVTAFRFALRNLTGRKRTVRVRLLPFASALPKNGDDRQGALPEPEIASGRANALLRKLSVGSPIAQSGDVELPAGDTPVPIAFKAATAGGAAKAAAGAKQPAAISLAHGMLAVIEDAKTKRVSLRAVSLAPQRPRRFLDIRVGYDEPRSQVTLRVRPKDEKWLPVEPVAVQCRFAGDTQPQPTLSGLLKRGDTELVLTGILRDKSATATLQIDVDDFPRAFLYRFRGDRSLTAVPEHLTRRSLQIVAPKSGAIFGKDATQIPVTFRVDAPVGSFQDGRDLVEIGIDVNRDRVLKNEPALRLPSDRQTAVTLDKIAEDGALEIKTAVGDYVVSLPTRGVPSRRIDLLGRLQVSGDSSWSNFVPIVFDTTAPGLEPVRIVRIAAGQSARFALQAEDAKLSGVRRIELFIDDKRTGKFPAEEGIVAAEATSKGDWVATLPSAEMKPGNYPVLVRAIDAAGNVSEMRTTRLVILTKAQATSNGAAKPNRVEGVLTFDKEPVAGAIMTLEPAAAAGKKPAAATPPPKIPPVKTDAAGKFAFPKVPPGRYSLTAFKRALANKNRKRSTTIQVASPPQPAVSVRMLLR